jgi:hypothetical protein
MQMALDGLGIAVMPPAIIENKTDARAKSRRLNTTIKLPNLDDVASWPTAAGDTGPQNRCHRHKGRTRLAWIAQKIQLIKLRQNDDWTTSCGLYLLRLVSGMEAKL